MNSKFISSLAGIFFFVSRISALTGTSKKIAKPLANDILGTVVVGPNGNCSAQNDGVIIEKQADLSVLNPCTSFYGWISVSITDSTSVTIPPGLTTIIGYLTFNDIIQTIEADGLIEIHTQPFQADNVTDGILIISSENPLSNISFPKLVDVRSLTMPYTSGLQTIDAFPALSKVYGDIYLNGTFTQVTFPSLTYIGGEFTVTSTDSNFQCPFVQYETDGVMQDGQLFTCGNVNHPIQGLAKPTTTAAANPSPTHTSAKSGSSKLYLGISNKEKQILILLGTKASIAMLISLWALWIYRV